MKVLVRLTSNFKLEVKPLLRKFRSLADDLQKLEKELTVTPHSGTFLGNNCYKIRLKIASKGKGKSGGARVITFVETEIIALTEIVNDEEITVNLLSIYDKSDVDTISIKELKELIKKIIGE